MGLKALLLITIGSIFLVACSSAATTPTPEPAATIRPAQGAPTATSVAPTASLSMTDSLQAQVDAVDAPQGGKLVLLERDPPTLDPHITTDNVSGRLVNEIFGGLVTLNPLQPAAFGRPSRHARLRLPVGSW